MNALILAIISFGGFVLAYRFYATFLAEKIFGPVFTRAQYSFPAGS